MMMKKSTKLQGIYRFLASPAISGAINTENDFIVKEHISPRYLRKHSFVGSKVQNIRGSNVIAILQKRGLTTDEALLKLAKMLNINKHDIGFAGLKDKNAVTYQYITVPKASFKSIVSKDMSVEKISETNNKLSPGDLVENEFTITLHNCRHLERLSKSIEKVREGMPNYFGLQRFGSNQNNHVIGKQMLNGRKLQLDRKKKKFMLHAYQSYLFNKMLSVYMDKHKQPSFSEAPLIGCTTKLENDIVGKIYRSILKEEKISIEDFSLQNMKCIGTKRSLFVKPKNLSYRLLDKDTVQLHFILPKGSYATMLISQLTHDMQAYAK